MLPVLVWLLGWFEWWFGVPAAALLVTSLWRALTGRIGDVQAVRRLAVVALPLALGCVMLLPPGGLVDPTGTDWVAHRAVFLDLARGDWPTYLPDYVSNEPPLLRYYLGYFIVPGLIAKWLGVDALHWAVPLWTWGGLALIVALAAEGLPTRRAMLLAAVVLVFFSGMDVVEHVLRDGLPAVARRLVEQFGVDGLAFIRSPSSAEWVAYHAYGIGDLASVPAPASPLFLEYLSNVHVFSVSPQHFIGGGLTTLLMLRLGKQPRFLAVSGIVLAGCLFWSSLLCVGLLPLAGVLLLKNGLRPFLGWRNLLLAPALAALLALYLASGQVDFPRGWLWQLYASGAQLAMDVGFFYLAEFLALALVLWWLQPKLGREPFFVVAVVVLLAVPWFWYGGPRFNEFHRVAIPSLFVLAYFAARAVAERAPADGAGRDGGRRWLESDLSGRAVFALLVAVLGVGATTAVYDFAKNIRRFGAIPYARTGYTLTTDVDAGHGGAEDGAPRSECAWGAVARQRPPERRLRRAAPSRRVQRVPRRKVARLRDRRLRPRTPGSAVQAACVRGRTRRRRRSLGWSLPRQRELRRPSPQRQRGLRRTGAAAGLSGSPHPHRAVHGCRRDDLGCRLRLHDEEAVRLGGLLPGSVRSAGVRCPSR